MKNRQGRSPSGSQSSSGARGARRQSAARATSARPHPIVTLLTDFGQQDPFVGIMKGVILSICPQAVLVDLTHETPPYNILGGSFLLQSAVRFFPPGTIHVGVVDPGVGGPRRPIVARIDEYLFVMPDNGLLSYPMASGKLHSVRAITGSDYRLHPVSASFHGRDVFAPAAGHLARGVSPARLGPEIADPVRLAIPRPQRDASGAIRGVVLWVDRFGNCITNIREQDLGEHGGSGRSQMQVHLDGRLLGPMVGFFGEVGAGGWGALVGSTGHLELFSNKGDLAREWGLAPGRPICLEWLKESGEKRGLEKAP